MNQEIFMKKIIEKVRNSAICAMETNLKKPAGRKPDKKLVEMSLWYGNLDESDRLVFKSIMLDAIDETIFGFLCILDGVRSIGVDGFLELIYKEEGNNVILNMTDIDLHDLYMSMINKE